MANTKPAGSRSTDNGWLTVKLAKDISDKLREMHAKTRVPLVAIVEMGIEREWVEWKKRQEEEGRK